MRFPGTLWTDAVALAVLRPEPPPASRALPPGRVVIDAPWGDSIRRYGLADSSRQFSFESALAGRGSPGPCVYHKPATQDV